MRAVLIGFFLIAGVWAADSVPGTPLVTRGSDDSLKYGTYGRGDRLCDFSHAGYSAGLKSPPLVKETITLSPEGPDKDDTRQIQQAIDKVSQNPEGSDGFRGAVLLGPGNFLVNGSLTIAASGVVLRGNGATLDCRGGKPRNILSCGRDQKLTVSSKGTAITDGYVPVGAASVHVADTTGITSGMHVLLTRKVTARWLASLGMDRLVRDHKHQTWIAVGSVLEIERKVTGVRDKSVNLDVPLCDSLDRTMFDEITLRPVTATNRIARIGVENLSFITRPAATEVGTASMTGVSILAVEDAWVRNCDFTDFMTAIETHRNTRRVTLSENRIARHSKVPGHAKPSDIKLQGSQVLIANGSSSSDRTVAFAVATMGASSTFGPNAVVGYRLANKDSQIYPHMRWGGTGLLVQDVHGGGVELINRQTFGSGHGWTSANSVVWNCGGALTVDSPPGYRNIVFGGSPKGTGTFFPAQNFGLYQAQLADRLKTMK